MATERAETPQEMHLSAARPVSHVLDKVAQAAEGEAMRLRELIEALGAASFLPLMMVPALAVVSPLSGIPGFSSLCGLTIGLFAAQMITRRRHVWAPRWLMHREISTPKARRAVAWLRRPARWLERTARPRLGALVRPPFSILPELACLVAGLAMPFLELFPFSSSLLGLSVVVLSVAMLTRDGLLALVGMAPFAGAVALVVALVG
ncbi:exopolysaccharide biosynthesis protein [Rhodovulum sp. ES.010]|uniref:exopolysaccharide biosynthesis protein n=1 Tax=Rhodovulum sp. ES.010 TaxID=1882821 RepID=UPI0020C9DD80|nr:exopolysaccharide biosynthesis protein [Rhodovulum sp. ES.010]